MLDRRRAEETTKSLRARALATAKRQGERELKALEALTPAELNAAVSSNKLPPIVDTASGSGSGSLKRRTSSGGLMRRRSGSISPKGMRRVGSGGSLTGEVRSALADGHGYLQIELGDEFEDEDDAYALTDSTFSTDEDTLCSDDNEDLLESSYRSESMVGGRRHHHPRHHQRRKGSKSPTSGSKKSNKGAEAKSPGKEENDKPAGVCEMEWNGMGG